MIGNRKIIIGGISLKPFYRSFVFANHEDVINCVFKGTVVIFRCITPSEAIVITNTFFGIFRCDVVSVAEVVFQKVLRCFREVIRIQIADENGRALIFRAVFFNLFREQSNLKFSCFIGTEQVLCVSEDLSVGGRFFPPKVRGGENEKLTAFFDAENAEIPRF